MGSLKVDVNQFWLSPPPLSLLVNFCQLFVNALEKQTLLSNLHKPAEFISMCGFKIRVYVEKREIVSLFGSILQNETKKLVKI